MILFKITDKKDFMNKFLNGDLFDSFLLGESVINTNISYVIDGHINPAFFSKEELSDTTLVPYDYIEWKQKKALFYDLIKGKKAPVSFQFVLYLKPDAMDKMLVSGNIRQTDIPLVHTVLNVKYDQNGLLLTTGISYSTFTLDRQIDNLWDTTMRKFLSSKEISFEEEV